MLFRDRRSRGGLLGLGILPVDRPRLLQGQDGPPRFLSNREGIMSREHQREDRWREVAPGVALDLQEVREMVGRLSFQEVGNEEVLRRVQGSRWAQNAASGLCALTGRPDDRACIDSTARSLAERFLRVGR